MKITKKKQAHGYKNELGLPMEKGGRRGKIGEMTKRYKLLCMKYTNYERILYNAGNILKVL